MPLETRIRIIDVKTGKVEVDCPSRSWTLEGIKILNSMLEVTLSSQIKDTGGTNRSLSLQSFNFIGVAGQGTITYGIVAGTNNTAESVNDYALGSIITHGTGAGQLIYMPSYSTEPINSSGTVSTYLQRNVYNGSGSSITINEVGVYTRMGAYYVCMLRDLVTVTINNGETKYIQYIIRTVN